MRLEPHTPKITNDSIHNLLVGVIRVRVRVRVRVRG